MSQASKRGHGKVDTAWGNETSKSGDGGEGNVVIEVRQQVPPHDDEGGGTASEKKQANEPVGLTSIGDIAASGRKQGSLLGKIMLAIKMEAAGSKNMSASSTLLSSTSSSSLAATTTLSLSAQQRRGYSVSQFFESLEDAGNRPIMRITKLIKIPTAAAIAP